MVQLRVIVLSAIIALAAAATPRTASASACCPGDWNNSGIASVQVVFDFLADWFGAGSGGAERVGARGCVPAAAGRDVGEPRVLPRAVAERGPDVHADVRGHGDVDVPAAGGAAGGRAADGDHGPEREHADVHV